MRARRELAQEEVLGGEPPERGEAPHGALQRPVGVAQPRRDHGSVLVRVREGDQPLERVVDEPGVGVDQQVVARQARRACRRCSPAPRPRFSCSITRTSGNRSRTRSSVPSVEPWSTSDRLARRRGSPGTARPTAARSGSPSRPRRQPLRSSRGRSRARVPRKPSQPRITAPGSASAIVTTKNRKPVANAASALDAELAEEADEERLAHGEPVDRERDEHDEEEQRPHHVVRRAARGRRRPPSRSARSPARAPPGSRASAR